MSVKRAISISLFALVAGAGVAAAQEKYPAKPVHLISPGSPGTILDVLARMYAEKLAQRLGQPVVVENRPGAGGTIASQIVAKAKPDGYTIQIVNNAHAINATLYSSLPYDTLRDFAGVSLVANSPAVVAIHPGLGVRTLPELIALAKQRPGTLNFGSGGVGTATHIAGEYFASQAGIEMVHVPYKVAAEVNTDLITGRIQASFAPIGFHLAQIRDGRLRALAVTSSERASILPDVPTVQEAAALAGFEYGTWYGLIAPAQTPRPILEQLARELRQATELAEIKDRMAAQGIFSRTSALRDFDAYIRAEIDKLGRIVKATGAKVN